MKFGMAGARIASIAAIATQGWALRSFSIPQTPYTTRACPVKLTASANMEPKSLCGAKHGIGCGDHHEPDREGGYFAFQDEREPDSHEPEKKDRRNESRDAQHHAYVPGCMGFLCLGHVAHSQARACE